VTFVVGDLVAVVPKARIRRRGFQRLRGRVTGVRVTRSGVLVTVSWPGIGVQSHFADTLRLVR